MKRWTCYFYNVFPTLLSVSCERFWVIVYNTPNSKIMSGCSVDEKSHLLSWLVLKNVGFQMT